MLSTHGYVDPVPQLGRTDTGGQVVYVLELAKALVSLGISVDLYTRWFDRSAKQIDPVTGDEKVRVIRIPAGPWEFLAKEVIYDVLPELAINMVGFIREHNLDYDLVHGHYVDAGIVTLDVAFALGKPAFFTPHSLGAWKRDQMKGDPDEMESKYNFNHRIAEELRIFQSVTAQSMTTELQTEKLKQLYDFESNNVVVIPPGVNVHEFSPPQPGDVKPREVSAGRYVFCLSRIDANKGHDLLLHAFNLVRSQIADVQLVIGGGSPNPQKRELDIFASMKEIIRDNGMEERTQILGYVPDDLLVSLYQHAELFVLPSVFEPFGMTALEAMACGTPVVASKFGGIRNVITNGQNGVLIDPTDAREFADGMISVLSDQALAGRFGSEGSHTIQESYSWEAIAQRHLELYGEFIT
jgi:mannosylfructose-phosphate synthase